MMSVTELARAAYKAYCKSCGGVSIRGEYLPTWEELPAKIKSNWECAALAIKKQILKDLNRDT